MVQGLTKRYIDRYGNTNTSAYFIIHSITVNYVDQWADIVVGIFKDQAAFIAKKAYLDIFIYNVKPTAYARASDGFIIPSFATMFPVDIQVGYALNIKDFVAWLKTTPELTGSV